MLQKKLSCAALLLLAFLCYRAVAHGQHALSPMISIPPSKLTFAFAAKDNFAQGREAEESTDESSSSGGSTWSIPTAPAVKEPRGMRPLSTVSIGFTANTLGAGVELATPLSRSFNLRTGVNFFSFSYPFSNGGVNYNVDLQLRSGQTSLDWFPMHGGFHISPGLMYSKNSFSSPSSVPPGQYFELGGQGFISSTNDPVNGTATLVFPRKFAPMLTLGFGNLLPRSGRHLSVPFEFGAVYTGVAQLDISLNGTACTSEGCFAFAQIPEAQDGLKQEIQILNQDLKKIPVYPIVSLGMAYRF